MLDCLWILASVYSECLLSYSTNKVILDKHLLQPLKWELKQKPGLSPPRGGFNPDDPNQQIVAEDIFDEYGGNSIIFTAYQYGIPQHRLKPRCSFRLQAFLVCPISPSCLQTFHQARQKASPKRTNTMIEEESCLLMMMGGEDPRSDIRRNKGIPIRNPTHQKARMMVDTRQWERGEAADTSIIDIQGLPRF